MPERILRHGWGFWRTHVTGVILTLLVVTLVVAIWGWSRASDAQSRINKVEVARQAEMIVEERGKQISQVVTCFSAARGRPLLTRILRGLAAREEDRTTRVAYEILIFDYERQPVPGISGRPTREKCAELGDKLDVGYAAYDFDPETGRLLQPAP